MVSNVNNFLIETKKNNQKRTGNPLFQLATFDLLI